MQETYIHTDVQVAAQPVRMDLADEQDRVRFAETQPEGLDRVVTTPRDGARLRALACCATVRLELMSAGRVRAASQHDSDLSRDLGELASRTGITPKTLRFYEQEGLLPPPQRAANGYRDYGPAVLPRLDFIRRGQAAGLTLSQIRDVIDIRDSGDPPCAHVYRMLTERLADVDRQLADLEALRATLLQKRDHARAADPSTCEPDTICRYV